jgi:hypothetical protein
MVPRPSQDLDALVAQISARLKPASEQLKWIKASVGTQLHLIPIDDVLFFQSDEKYTLVVTRELETLIRTPIKEILDGLDTNKFWQIHRSTIVNATAIDTVSRDFRGQASVKIKGRPETLVVSRPFSHLQGGVGAKAASCRALRYAASQALGGRRQRLVQCIIHRDGYCATDLGQEPRIAPLLVTGRR